MPEASLAAEDLRWLQALARRLARDPAEADDLVQEAWLAAERSPSAPTRSRRAWLHGVLRNRERMLRRSEARRRRREAEAEGGRAAAGAELELHRQRVLSTLHEIMEELEDDDRTLLLSRYCEEHHAPELAERLGLPASTVRSRLSRATARVRQRLDERWGGDRQAWAPAVLAFPASAPVGGPALTSWKRGSMTTVGMKIAILAVAASTAVGAWGVATGRFGGRGDEAPASTSTSPADDAEAERTARLAQLRTQHEESPPDRTPAALDGRVVAADGGAPIGGALVMVMRRGTDGPRLSSRVLTDADGSFRLEGLPAGRYTVTAAALGHLPVRHDALALAPGEQRHALQLPVKAGGNLLEGTITDIGGGPVEGALVQAFDRAPTEAQRVAYGAITDAEGHYRMMLPDGRWTMEAGGEDYSPARKNVQLTRGPGHADFVLVPGAEIHGRVVERGTDRAVAGATVGFTRRASHGSTRSLETSTPRETVVTDEQGRFVLRPLEPADYALHARAPGLATLASARVAAAIGETITDVVVPIDPAFDASGFVVDASDPTRGLGDVEIIAMIPGHDTHAYVVSEPDGYFELQGLLPGTHMIMLAGDGLLSTGFEQQVRIEAADRDDLLIELEHGAGVRGRVEPPMAGTVQVKSRQESGGVEVVLATIKLTQSTAAIAPDGSFDIGTVPPGEWKLAVEGEDGSQGELEIAVSEAGLEDVVVSLSPRPHVAGTVLDEAGHPLAGLSVRLDGEPDPSRPPGPLSGVPTRGTAVTAADGSFVIHGLGPERLTLVVEDGRSQPVKLLDATQATVVVADRDVEGLELRAALPQGRITGLVRGPDGEPLADAMVVVSAASDGKGMRHESEYTPTVTDADGRFVFEGLADRSYDLHAHGPDADARGSRPAVAPGADVTLELEPLAVLQGVVTRDGVPVPRFELDACEIGGRQTILSPSGSFTLRRLAAGPCHVLVTTDDGAANATVELTHGGTGHVALEIGAWGSVEGVLVSASDGTPLAGVQVVMQGKSGQRRADDRLIAAMLGGGSSSKTTDAQGRFTVDGIGPGHGKLELRIGGGLLKGRGQTLGHHAFAIEPGQALDLGPIVVLAPVDVPEAERGSLGMKVERSRAKGDATADASETRPAEITWLEPGGPAERAGLRVGDRVVGFDGLDQAKLGTPTFLDAFQPSRIQAGREHAVQIVRDGSPLSVTVVARPAEG